MKFPENFLWGGESAIQCEGGYDKGGEDWLMSTRGSRQIRCRHWGFVYK